MSNEMSTASGAGKEPRRARRRSVRRDEDDTPGFPAASAGHSPKGGRAGSNGRSNPVNTAADADAAIDWILTHLDTCDEKLSEIQYWMQEGGARNDGREPPEQYLAMPAQELLLDMPLKKLPPLIKDILKFLARNGIGTLRAIPAQDGSGTLEIDGAAIALPAVPFATAETLIAAGAARGMTSADDEFIPFTPMTTLARELSRRLGRKFSHHSASNAISRLRKALINHHVNPYLLQRSELGARFRARHGHLEERSA